MPRVFAPSPLAGEACPERSRRGQDGGRSGSPLRIDDNGDLILHAESGKIRLHKPRIYQDINGVKHPISGSYVLFELETQNSELETQQVGFQVAAYDTGRPLIIDPVLSYSTYLGGSSVDAGFGIAVDSSGNAYVTGLTASPDFPTANPLQPTFGGGSGSLPFGGDAFVAKLNSTGSAFVYSTYLGGSDGDGGFGIAVDSSGNAYVTGGTFSADFPIANPLQAAFGGGSHWGDAFVVKLDPTGSAFVYSTYLGGSSNDSGVDIAVNTSGNAYVTGGTYSTDFPTANPLQPTFGGGYYDAFVAKVNPVGSALVYSTYLGGSSDDFGIGIGVDASGNAYVTGFTPSPNFPTANPLQAAFGGSFDAFVAKVDPTGSTLVYSTYLGGSSDDIGFGIAVDASGNAYVTGATPSPNFPTANPLQPAFGGGADAFVTKVELAVETPVGTTTVQPIDATTGTTPVTLTFSNVTQAGTTSLTTAVLDQHLPQASNWAAQRPTMS